MALSFPLSLATFGSLLRMAPGTSWSLYRNDQLSGLASGQVLAAELASPLWTADVETAELNNSEIRPLRALANALQGPQNTFYLYDPVGQYPVNDPTGTLLNGYTIKINTLNVNGKALSFKGAPPGFVFSAGDFFHFDYGSPTLRALHELSEGGTVAGDGTTSELEVSTYFRTGVTTNTTVTFLKPAAKVFIMPGTLKPQTVSVVTSKLTMTVMQRL